MASFFSSSGSSRRKTPSGGHKRKVFYFIYGLVVFAMVLGANLLSTRVEPMIRAELQKQPDYNIMAGTIVPQFFPPAITFTDLNIGLKKGKGHLAFFNVFSAGLDLPSLAKGRLALNFDISAYGGKLRGVLGTGWVFNINSFSAEAVCEGIIIGLVPAVRDLKLGLSGVGSFKLNTQGDIDDPGSYSGDVQFKIANPAFTGIKPLFKVPKVKADSLIANARLENLVLNVQKLNLNGKSLTGNMSGTISIIPEKFNDSKLDLKGQVKADLSLFNQKAIVQKKAIALMRAKKFIPVELSDTISNPWVSLPN